MAQTVWPTGGARWLGTYRHYQITGEQVEFSLVNNDGTPYTTGSTANAINTAEVQATVRNPLDAGDDLHTNPLANGFIHFGNGVYGLLLGGEGAANGHDSNLGLVGEYSVYVRPTGTANFLPVMANYHVRADWEVRAAFTYLNQPDRISGCISVRRWWNKVLLDKPLDAVGAIGSRTSHLASLVVAISDISGTLATITQAGGDLTQGADSNIYFNKAITGLTGARSMNARVTANFVNGSAVTIDNIAVDFPIIAPFAS